MPMIARWIIPMRYDPSTTSKPHVWKELRTYVVTTRALRMEWIDIETTRRMKRSRPFEGFVERSSYQRRLDEPTHARDGVSACVLRRALDHSVPMSMGIGNGDAIVSFIALFPKSRASRWCRIEIRGYKCRGCTEPSEGSHVGPPLRIFDTILWGCPPPGRFVGRGLGFLCTRPTFGFDWRTLFRSKGDPGPVRKGTRADGWRGGASGERRVAACTLPLEGATAPGPSLPSLPTGVHLHLGGCICSPGSRTLPNQPTEEKPSWIHEVNFSQSTWDHIGASRRRSRRRAPPFPWKNGRAKRRKGSEEACT